MSTPAAVFVVGPAGSGKSTVARAVARLIRGAYLDKDVLSGDLVRFALDRNGDRADDRESNAFYREHVMPLEYSSLFAVARDNLALGMSVVIDAPFAAYLEDENYFERITRAAGWPAAHAVVLRVRANEDAVRRRILERANPRDEWKLAHWDEFWSSLGVVECRWRGVEVVDVANDAEPDLTNVVARLAL